MAENLSQSSLWETLACRAELSQNLPDTLYARVNLPGGPSSAPPPQLFSSATVAVAVATLMPRPSQGFDDVINSLVH
jgi:hypothetical protein